MLGCRPRYFLSRTQRRLPLASRAIRPPRHVPVHFRAVAIPHCSKEATARSDYNDDSNFSRLPLLQDGQLGLGEARVLAVEVDRQDLCPADGGDGGPSFPDLRLMLGLLFPCCLVHCCSLAHKETVTCSNAVR
jgi:hypothetical protein